MIFALSAAEHGLEDGIADRSSRAVWVLVGHAAVGLQPGCSNWPNRRMRLTYRAVFRWVSLNFLVNFAPGTRVRSALKLNGVESGPHGYIRQPERIVTQVEQFFSIEASLRTVELRSEILCGLFPRSSTSTLPRSSQLNGYSINLRSLAFLEAIRCNYKDSQCASAPPLRCSFRRS